MLYATNSPTTVPPVRINEIEAMFDESTRGSLNHAQAEVDGWNLQSLDVPPLARILEDSPIPYDAHVFIHGNPKLKGEEVERQFLGLLAGEHRQPFQHGSGRLEMAQAIASRENPLTARVMANRIWQHHFGAGLVGTPSNFGLGGEAPTHPELLDYLAWQFMDGGWSIKKLHRLILLSSTYQQRSAFDRGHALLDPENHLLWRMNRRRLDFEATRDSLLAVAGTLDETMGGRSDPLSGPPRPSRRAVYCYIDRQNLPGLFATFDFANPDQHSPQRSSTTVPQQALFFMNSPFVMHQAQSLAARAEVAASAHPDNRIRQLYSIVFQRPPTQRELETGLHFVTTVPSNPQAKTGKNVTLLTAWERYAQALRPGSAARSQSAAGAQTKRPRAGRPKMCPAPGLCVTKIRRQELPRSDRSLNSDRSGPRCATSRYHASICNDSFNRIAPEELDRRSMPTKMLREAARRAASNLMKVRHWRSPRVGKEKHQSQFVWQQYNRATRNSIRLACNDELAVTFGRTSERAGR